MNKYLSRAFFFSLGALATFFVSGSGEPYGAVNVRESGIASVPKIAPELEPGTMEARLSQQTLSPRFTEEPSEDLVHPDDILFFSCASSLHSQKTQYISTAPSDNDSRLETVNVAGKQIITAKNAYDQAKDNTAEHIDARIRLATWQLLFGELAIGSPEFGQYRNGAWAFEEGTEHLVDIEAFFQANPKIESEIGLDPSRRAVLLRYDLVRTRETAIQNNQKLTWQFQESRVEKLKTLVVTYKKLTELLTNSHVQLLTGDNQASLKSYNEVMRNIISLRQTVNTDREFYLYNSEPDLENAESDFEVVNLTPNPYSDEMLAHLKAMYSLGMLRDNEDISKGIYEETIKMADASLSDKNLNELPEGYDSENLIGLYTLSQATKLDSEKQLAPAPYIRNNLDANLKKSLSITEKVLSLSAERKLESSAIFKSASQTRIDLTSPQYFIDKAKTAIVNGNIEGASQTSWRGLIYHPLPELWQLWVESTLASPNKVGEVKQHLEAARVANAFPNSNFYKLLKAKTLVREAQIAFAFNNQAQQVLPQPIIDKLLVTLNELDSVNKDPGHTLDGFTLTTQIAAMLAWSDDEQLSNQELTNITQAGRRNIAQLRALTVADEYEKLWVTEQLVRANSAAGLLLTKLLPKYHPDGVFYLQTAVDLAATLPYENATNSILGTPLLNIYGNRTLNDDQIDGIEQLRSRNIMARFANAVYIQEFGGAAMAAPYFASAMVEHNKDSQNRGDTINASELSQIADGFDSTIGLKETVTAFKVLSHVKNNEPDSAVRTALSLVGIDYNSSETLVFERIESMIAAVDSPFVLYSLGLAFENKLDSLGIVPSDLHTAMLRIASAAYRNCSSKMEYEIYREKYPFLESLVEQAQVRTGSQSYYAFEQLASTENYNVAARTAKQAIIRFPNYSQGWIAYFRDAFSSASIGDMQKIQGILANLDVLIDQENASVPASVLLYYKALAESQLKQFGAATETLEVGINQSTSSLNTIRALSLSATVKLQEQTGVKNEEQSP